MVVTMGHDIIVSLDSPFTVDNIPFGVIKTAKDITPRCASAIGDYAIDLSLYAGLGSLDSVDGGNELKDVFSQVCSALRIFSRGAEWSTSNILIKSPPSRPSTHLLHSPERSVEQCARRYAQMSSSGG